LNKIGILRWISVQFEGYIFINHFGEKQVPAKQKATAVSLAREAVKTAKTQLKKAEKKETVKKRP